MTADFAQQRTKMVDGQLRTTDVTSASVLQAMGSVPREEFVAEAEVIKAGRTLTVTRCDVYSRGAGESRVVATMLATMIRR